MLSESENDMLGKWLTTKDLQEFIELGMKLDPTQTKEELMEAFGVTPEEHAEPEANGNANGADRMDDKEMENWLNKFYEVSEADTVEEQKALLQKIYNGTLTPKEMDKLFPKD